MIAPKNHSILALDTGSVLIREINQNLRPGRGIVMETQSNSDFQKQFQHPLQGCVERGFLGEEWVTRLN